jgi:hypothetical protein
MLFVARQSPSSPAAREKERDNDHGRLVSTKVVATLSGLVSGGGEKPSPASSGSSSSRTSPSRSPRLGPAAVIKPISPPPSPRPVSGASTASASSAAAPAKTSCVASGPSPPMQAPADIVTVAIAKPGQAASAYTVVAHPPANLASGVPPGHAKGEEGPTRQRSMTAGSRLDAAATPASLAKPNTNASPPRYSPAAPMSSAGTASPSPMPAVFRKGTAPETFGTQRGAQRASPFPEPSRKPFVWNLFPLMSL